MVRKEDVDFYCGLSRKELQSLCKKYNLPANRSSSDMAESLASYFELQKNSWNSVGFGVAGNQVSSATTSRAPASRTCDAKRDSYGNELDISRGGCFQGTVAREPGFILGESTQYQERNGGLIDSECAPPYMKKLNGNGPTDSRLENRMKEVDSGGSHSSSSFEFHVSLEEGISLSVDLNFNPSDWINSMRDEVNVCDSMRRRKSPHPDLGIDNATKCKKQKSSGQDKDGHVRKESSISPEIKDNTQVPSDHHSNGERSLASSAAIQPCSRSSAGSDTCKEKDGLNLSIPDSAGPGQIVSSCVESYNKSCCVNPGDLDCVNLPGKKLSSESVMVATEQNHPAGDILIEIPENPSMERFQKVVNSSTAICPRGAGSELSSSEAEAFSPRKTSRSSNISSSELIVDRESNSYSESFKFLYNGGKNSLPPNTEEQVEHHSCKQ
ncbi:uncharacterized protein LOC18020246 [Eutrema salsugineum]|uniref:uncharacterized protein LOC18020246 n=1 Tax=Eutrema salsugineum TaxID=72664 RepID=UPI000CED5F83|nr:uncharacterized protein LOC18020246 [Eutrema salsugineum]XP_024012736.1 uncharacterized protein LOC18020246 [Eutrema salsugineum]